MPALKLYGRKWYTTSDMLPLPAALFALIALVWVIVFGVIVANLDIWQPCHGQGVHFMVITAGLVAVYGLSFLLTLGMTYFGSRGTCFEISKRQGVVPLLYAQSVVWACQLILLVYGTVAMYAAAPTCRRGRETRHNIRRLAHAMIYSTWGLVIAIAVLVYLVYNSYQGKDKLRSWEHRLKRVSHLFCCQEAVAAPMNGRSSALPDIAQWVSALFANVDLSPTDLTEAVVLAAAAQTLRRKMRIRRALHARADGVAGSDASSTSTSLASPDGLTSILSDRTLDSDSSDDGGSSAYVKAHVMVNGHANGARTPSATSVRSPKGERGALGAGRMGQGRRSDEIGRAPERSSLESTRRISAEGMRQQSCIGSEMTSAFAGSSLQSVAGSDPERRRLDGSSTGGSRPPSFEVVPEGSEGSATSHVSLSQVDNLMLEAFTASSRRAIGRPPTPAERFGIPSKSRRSGGSKSRLGPSVVEASREPPAASVGPESGPQAPPPSGLPPSSRDRSKGDSSLPSSMAGKLQAGLNEPEGGLPPPTASSLAPAFTFESSIPHTVDCTSLDVGADDDIAGDDWDGEVLALPLDKLAAAGDRRELRPDSAGREGAPPPLITPSEQVVETTRGSVPMQEAVKEAIGHRAPAEYEVLEEAKDWARFASAVYAVAPFTEQGYAGKLLRRHPNTEESVRDDVIGLAGIEAEDLLYFSHSNTALAHLPYMVALDRKRKAVVVAIRGTMSLADLVTDAVVHPEPLKDWLPAATRKVKRRADAGHKKAYAHAGITSAAKAVLEDLEIHGILTTLLQPEAVRRQSAEYLQCMRHHGAGGAGEADEAVKARAARRGVSEQAWAPPDGTQDKEGDVVKDTEGAQAGGVWPAEEEDPSRGESSDGPRQGDGPTRSQRNEMAGAARQAQGSTRRKGEATGEALQKNLDTKGWRLVITGHSLGAGAAALIGLKIRDRYPDLRVWAFCPPGGLISKSLVGFTESWCTSVAVGKDVVPRMTVNNLSRLMDEMVTALARCRHHKLRVLLGGWWRKESRPPPERLFHSYGDIPAESRLTLERYHKSTARKGKAKDMFPPGRILFVRPLKTLDGKKGEGRALKNSWDAVWVTSQELVDEGILVSKKMLAHHSITNTLLDALGHAAHYHPSNPRPEPEKRAERREEEGMKHELNDIRVDREGRGPMDMLASAPST